MKRPNCPICNKLLTKELLPKSDVRRLVWACKDCAIYDVKLKTPNDSSFF